MCHANDYGNGHLLKHVLKRVPFGLVISMLSIAVRLLYRSGIEVIITKGNRPVIWQTHNGICETYAIISEIN